jgi:hypothetical protein
MRIALLAFAVGVGITSSASALDRSEAARWRAFARECQLDAENNLHAATGCASCTDSWVAGATCAIDRFYDGKISEEVTKGCVTEVWNRRFLAKTCHLCGNPIDETRDCVRHQTGAP